MADKQGFSQIGTASADEQNMAQIREILFGEQSRQTAQELKRLDTRLGEQEQRLLALFEQRSMELSGALETLRGELGREGDRQQAALDKVASALHALLDQLDNRLTVLDSDLQDGNHRLEQAIAEQAAALERVEQRSVGRAQLAVLLETLARQLRDADAR